MTGARGHGGLDTAMARYGGRREDWVDLSTGINPVPYPVPLLDPKACTALPGRAAHDTLTQAAREFWGMPDDAAILAAPGTASLVAHVPGLLRAGRVHIPAPVRTRHAKAFAAHGWTEGEDSPDARVLVHPDDPTGGWYSSDGPGAVAVEALVVLGVVCAMPRTVVKTVGYRHEHRRPQDRRPRQRQEE